jgi:hypothetical protein
MSIMRVEGIDAALTPDVGAPQIPHDQQRRRTGVASPSPAFHDHEYLNRVIRRPATHDHEK